MGYMTTNAGIYVRISDDATEKGLGIARQEADARAHAKRLGWAVTRVYAENDTSAYKRRKVTLANGQEEFRVIRPEFRAMLDALEAGEISAFVAYDLDRVARDPRDLEDLIDLREQHGIQVSSVTGSLRLDSDADITMARVMVAIANKSSRDTSRRVSRAHKESAVRGQFGGGLRRMGYTSTADAVVPQEAKEIAWAYQHVAAGGTLESVCRRWRKTLGKGPLGGEITGVQVRDVLMRGMNAGLSFYKGKEVGEMDPSIPRLIDVDTWRTVNAILSDPSRRTTVGKPPKSLLSPVMRCGKCGFRMGSAYRRRKRITKAESHKERDPIYRCRQCGNSRHRERFDEVITQLVGQYLENNSKALKKPTPAATGPDEGALEVERLRERLIDLGELVAAGDLDPADYAIAATRIRERLAAVEKALVKRSRRPATAALVAKEDIRQTWESLSTDDKRAVLVEIIEVITVGPGTPGRFTMDGVEIQWKD